MAGLNQVGQSEPCIEVPEERWREIEVGIGLQEPNLELRCRIAECVELYYAPEETWLPSFRPKDLRPWLERIRKDTIQLLQHLAIQEDANLSESERWGRAAVVFDLMPQKDRAELCAVLSKLVASADAALQSLPHDPGGPLRDWRLFGLIGALATAYVDETGKAPGVSQTPPGKGKSRRYSGPFFRLVEAVFAGIVPQIDPTFQPPKSSQAVGKTIQRALEYWPPSFRPKAG